MGHSSGFSAKQKRDAARRRCGPTRPASAASGDVSPLDAGPRAGVGGAAPRAGGRGVVRPRLRRPHPPRRPPAPVPATTSAATSAAGRLLAARPPDSDTRYAVPAESASAGHSWTCRSPPNSPPPSRRHRCRRLPPGDRLPPVRELAPTEHVSAAVAGEAYVMLAREGRVVSRVGRGTYVARPREGDDPLVDLGAERRRRRCRRSSTCRSAWPAPARRARSTSRRPAGGRRPGRRGGRGRAGGGRARGGRRAVPLRAAAGRPRRSASGRRAWRVAGLTPTPTSWSPPPASRRSTWPSGRWSSRATPCSARRRPTPARSTPWSPPGPGWCRCRSTRTGCGSTRSPTRSARAAAAAVREPDRQQRHRHRAAGRPPGRGWRRSPPSGAGGDGGRHRRGPRLRRRRAAAGRGLRPGGAGGAGQELAEDGAARPAPRRDLAAVAGAARAGGEAGRRPLHGSAAGAPSPATSPGRRPPSTSSGRGSTATAATRSALAGAPARRPRHVAAAARRLQPVAAAARPRVGGGDLRARRRPRRGGLPRAPYVPPGVPTAHLRLSFSTVTPAEADRGIARLALALRDALGGGGRDRSFESV